MGQDPDNVQTTIWGHYNTEKDDNMEKADYGPIQPAHGRCHDTDIETATAGNKITK